MKIKDLIPSKGPLGWIIAAGVVALVTSPSAKKTVRQLMVKGTATTMKLSDQAREKTIEWIEKVKKPNPPESHEYAFDFSSNEKTASYPPVTVLNTNDETEDDHSQSQESKSENDHSEGLHGEENNDKKDHNQ